MANSFTEKQETFMLQKDFGPFVRLFFPSIPDTEVNELAQSYSKKDRSTSFSADLSLEELSSTTTNPKVPLAEVDIQFDKWYKEDQVLSGVLNSRVTKQKNLDLKAKIIFWKQRDAERKRTKK